jgi:hypothetical protein
MRRTSRGQSGVRKIFRPQGKRASKMVGELSMFTHPGNPEVPLPKLSFKFARRHARNHVLVPLEDLSTQRMIALPLDRSLNRPTGNVNTSEWHYHLTHSLHPCDKHSQRPGLV